MAVRCDHHCVIRNPRELLVHGGVEVFAQYLHEKTKRILKLKEKTDCKKEIKRNRLCTRHGEGCTTLSINNLKKNLIKSKK
jgi:hypothetical protein